MSVRNDAETIIQETLAACRPERAVRRALAGKVFSPGRLLLVAIGKAAWPMASCAAAELGRVRVMLSARLMMGNCCSNSGQYEGMERHYRIAERMASDLGDADALRTIRYNRASTAIELGRAEEGYAYFSALPEPTAMELHKLAAACELLGKREEALAALDRVSAAPRGGAEVENAVVDEMCAVLRWRLERPDYLSSAEYGRRLLALFQRLRGELPPGYAGFHLGRVLEWLRANRQYKRALDILRDFPGYYS